MDGTDWHPNEAPGANGAAHPPRVDQGPSLHDTTPSGEEEGGEDYEEEYDGESEDRSIVYQLRRRGLLPTGCCYDDRMKLHYNADFTSHPHHPEDPRRIEEIIKAFKKAGLLYSGPETEVARITRDAPTKYMWRIAAREASKEEILTTHTPDHFTWVKRLSTMSYTELRQTSRVMDQGRSSLYVGSLSYPAALLSCGGAIDTCKQVVEGNVKNAFAVIRPPGHHAEYDQPLGFCFFNNVPVAVKICQREYPELCRKVLILDWDVHHGNGIQNIFYEDPNVLYISLHVYQNGNFYPGKPENSQVPDGGMEHCGTGPGLGKNVNIGWHDQGMGDGEYMAAFQKIVMPIAQEFNPDLVVVSAGFDAADGDELGGCFVTPPCYAHMTHMLMSLADGKVAVCLEGGYNLRAISKSAVAVARTLMGEPPPKMDIPKVNKEAARVLATAQAYQAPHWECMRPGIVNVPDLQDLRATRLQDHIRLGQRQELATRHQMIPLYIQRDVLFKAYENQVLVTPTLQLARRLLVVIHDPPQLVAQPDAIDNHLESHNAWIVDGVTEYVNWAISEGMGVMDVNVPSAVPHEDDTDPFTARSPEKILQAQLQELVCYLWDNYIQLYDNATDIFLMGVGNAYLGVKLLLMNRDCKDRISGVINFVTGTLRPIKSDVDQDLSAWYKEHSRVYISSDHACWQNEDLTRKVQKRRFGTVKRSPVQGLGKMLQHHADEAKEWIMEIIERNAGDTTEEDKPE
ncbi:histone deacetylase clr3 [Sodiomyces alkalinus F11]|uniref:Histone deacetylase n=1 Tax=Sodiomyces alkalinus (strain CBS 110278 / VKM F-3762 / F11) TaxID=1314773 RepID=A0A3N2Q0E7_SODAK|nr:histone deacetylase clr3 [Sodiomyces alkalinus F11]ROT40241.1 histone deacetylase clr3 [Sodiomyces alkalinus F11]